MPALDTHRAYEAFKEAGFSTPQAEALLDTLREEREALATKADLQALEERMNARFKEHQQQTDARFKALEHQMDSRLQSLELRITLRLGALVVAVAILLAILELIP